jgi:tRNA nucleotidyltransferase (CCA-adding enzyme)
MQILKPENVRNENLEQNPNVLTPKSVSEQNPPDRVYAHTRKYGETISTLRPGFEANVEKYEGVYEVDVPDEVLKVCKEIYGLGGRALLVGGSVRDAVISKEFPEMGLTPKDFDIEVSGMSPEQLLLILEKSFGSENVDVWGKAFEVIKVKIRGSDGPLDLDVSIPRKDSKTGEGHKGFLIQGDPTMTIDEASLRRDLTINSVAYDPLTKTLYDAYGGVRDIKKRMIEVTYVEAFQEDPLRVMRIMQFSSRFGFEVSDRATELCAQMVARGDLDQLPRERISEEVTKLFKKGIKPSTGLEFALKVGFIDRYWQEVGALVDVPQEKGWHPEGDVWTHTLQVVDAAAEIADREIKADSMSEDDKLVLVAAALCHDFGKPATTQFIDGAYRARGHETAGVNPTREFLERIFGDPEAGGISDKTRRVLPLVAEHLKPREFWLNEVKEGIDQSAAIRKLSQRLSEGHNKTYSDGGGSSIYMLALVAEADQRGRNGQGNTFLPREYVPELEEWQSWLLRRSSELKVELKPPEKLLTATALLESLEIKKGDVWVGVVLEAAYADQIDGAITSPEDALVTGLAYFSTMSEKVKKESERKSVPERNVWEGLRRLEDPREYLAA